MYNDDNKNKNRTPSDENPVGNAVEIRVVGRIVLACIGAVFLALTYRLVKWIVGF